MPIETTTATRGTLKTRFMGNANKENPQLWDKFYWSHLSSSSLLFCPASKESSCRGIPSTWDKIYYPLNSILPQKRDFTQLADYQ